MFKNRPAMRFCVPFMLGIIIGWKLSLPLIPLSIFILAFLICFLLVSSIKSWCHLSAPAAFVLLMLFGAVKITFDAKLVTGNNVSNYIAPGKSVTLYGSITDLPRVSDYAVRFVVEADSVRIYDKIFQASGGAAVSVLKKKSDTSCLPLMSYGRKMILQGELSKIRTARNPGAFDLRNYLNLNNIYASFYPVGLDSNCIGTSQEQDILATIVYPVRQSVTKTIDKLFTGEAAQFLKGLLVGERSEISLEVKNAFINSGVMHILAVSGLHVAIVTFIIIIMLQVVRIPEKARMILTCVLLIYYNYLTGNTPSVTRSVIMAIVFLSAKLTERKSDMYNTLAFSAFVLLLIDAKDLFQPGFQLSFAAVFSIVYLYPKIYNLKNHLPPTLKNNLIITGVFATIAVSAAAGIGTLPFTSVYFGKISVISIIANAVIVPLSNVILALGMIAVALAYLSFWLSSIYAEVTSSLTWLLLKLVDVFSNIPFAYLESRFTVVSSLLFYAAAGVVVQFRRRELFGRNVIQLLILLNVWFYGMIFFNSTDDTLRVTFLDVGEGDAIFVEFPDGKNILIDAGPRSFGGDAGSRLVAPFLKYKRITHINSIMISHPDADHLGGVPTILRNFRVDEVIDPGIECKSSLCEEYLYLIDSLKLNRIIVHAGQKITVSEKGRMYILNPKENVTAENFGKRISLNNRSIVSKLVYGKTSLLLTGDAEEAIEKTELKSYDSFLQSDILKVAHHGSNSGSSPEFIGKVQPEFAVISVGVKNKFKHPSNQVLKRIREMNCICCRTDELGALVFRSNGEEWQGVDWRSLIFYD